MVLGHAIKTRAESSYDAPRNRSHSAPLLIHCFQSAFQLANAAAAAAATRLLIPPPPQVSV